MYDLNERDKSTLRKFKFNIKAFLKLKKKKKAMINQLKTSVEKMKETTVNFGSQNLENQA